MGPPNQPQDIWRILLVDDEESVHAVLGRMFHRMGQTVRGVMNGPDALLLLREPWDLFVLDKNLPAGSGLEVAKAARAAHPEAVIVMLTGYASRESADALVGIADEYVTKPFELEYLKETIAALMDLRRVGRLARALQQQAPAPGPSSGPPPSGTPPGARSPALTSPPEANRPSPPPSASTAAARPAGPSALTSRPSPPRAPGPSAAGPVPAPQPSAPGVGRHVTRSIGPGVGALKVHIVVSDLRDEVTLLTAARVAGLHASSGPLADDAFPDVMVVDGKAATFELRKAVWLRQARNAQFRVVMVVEGATLADATAAVALKATSRVQRPVSADAATELMAKLKG